MLTRAVKQLHLVHSIVTTLHSLLFKMILENKNADSCYLLWFKGFRLTVLKFLIINLKHVRSLTSRYVERYPGICGPSQINNFSLRNFWGFSSARLSKYPMWSNLLRTFPACTKIAFNEFISYTVALGWSLVT